MIELLRRKQEILIVDDAPINIQVLADMLKDDYLVKVATHGHKALEIARDNDAPDLILLDVMMPGMDGFEVCRCLKADACTKDIPIIFVTARDELRDEERGLELGAVDYISKPFQLPIVKARIRNHLNLKLKTDLLSELALLDGLTSIPNRRRLDELLELECRRAARAESTVSVLMIDVDDFKAYNDTYGHGAGDECLKQIATTLLTGLKRPADMVARYGGEEFVVLLPETDAEAAAHVAERLRAHIEARQIPHVNSRAANHVTISVGCATSVTGSDCCGDALLDLADKNLYAAKENGRNTVCTSD